MRTSEARSKALADMTEAEWISQLIELAHLHGWVVAHFRPSRTGRIYIGKDGKLKEKWTTAFQADGAGFPDLVLVRQKDGRLIFAECKRQRGALFLAQSKWLLILSAIPCAEVHIWRPRDFQAIAQVLE